MKKFTALAIILAITVALCTAVFADNSKLQVNKTTFAAGEPILVTATGSGTDWVGIQRTEIKEGSAGWVYVETVGSGTQFNLLENLRDVNTEFTAGKWTIALVANDNPWSNTAEWIESIEIEITDTSSSSAAELKNKSWDGITVDGTLVSPATGQADVWIKENEVKGEISTINVRGWAFLSTAITGFAYTIDGNSAVSSADYIQDRPDVKDAIDQTAEGFNFDIDVSNVGKGAHTIKIFVVDANGELVDTTFELPFTQEKEAAAPENPGTADASVIAVAAVACVALAGVVVAKKVK